MAYKYVVVHEFQDYNKGDEITDPDEIAAVLADNPSFVVQVYVPDAAAAGNGGASTASAKTEGA